MRSSLQTQSALCTNELQVLYADYQEQHSLIWCICVLCIRCFSWVKSVWLGWGWLVKQESVGFEEGRKWDIRLPHCLTILQIGTQCNPVTPGQMCSIVLSRGNCSRPIKCNFYWNVESYELRVWCECRASVRPGQSHHSMQGFNARQCPGWIKNNCCDIFAQPGPKEVNGMYLANNATEDWRKQPWNDLNYGQVNN